MYTVARFVKSADNVSMIAVKLTLHAFATADQSDAPSNFFKVDWPDYNMKYNIEKCTDSGRLPKQRLNCFLLNELQRGAYMLNYELISDCCCNCGRDNYLRKHSR